ncbi:MAG TPA: pirin family protein [Myxococcaceae bacterium]|nr:pirin family protein [Myxococcaceae bacterium]
MIQVRPSSARGHANYGWLDTRHTFSFSDYYDPKFMGFRSLRVINEDRVQPGAGFPTHSHRDMEIISYVLDGAIEHKDSTGTGSILRPGEVQRMSAGTGVQHSEFNPSKKDVLHFLQIWILPKELGIAPEYEQKSFPEQERTGKLRLVASSDGRDGSVSVHQDVALFASIAKPGQQLQYEIARGRYGWLQVARGEVTLNGTGLNAGDGAAISEERLLRIGADKEAEILLFDLA